MLKDITDWTHIGMASRIAKTLNAIRLSERILPSSAIIHAARMNDIASRQNAEASKAGIFKPPISVTASP
jgi:hypothetical protein